MVTLRYRSTLRFPLGFYMESRASQEPRRWISCFRALSEPLAGAVVASGGLSNSAQERTIGRNSQRSLAGATSNS